MKNKRKIFSNIRSSASAGAGKTFNLTSRYIAIALAEGDPSCITALTFTRKSAGEFISEILRRVANGASDSISAAKLSEEICSDANAYTQNDFFELLQKLVSNLNKLKLGTIDSFCSELIHAFAEEFGVFVNPSMMSDTEAEKARSDSLERVFRKNSVSQDVFNDFAEHLKKATFNLKEKSLTSKIFEKIKQAYHAYEKHPELKYWGNPKMFSNVKVEKFDEKKYLELLNQLGKLEQKEGLEKLNISKFFAQCNGITYPELNTLAKRLTQLYRNGALVGGAELLYRGKPYALSSECASVICKIFDSILASHLYLSCRAVRAIGEIIALYKKEYLQNVVSRGKFVFEDIPTILLSPDHRIETLVMEERLDSKYRHWLFDEFQDTSRLQWKVFENLIDEVVFDETRERSFYYVGDVKQSIYCWRGGDRRLFSEVFEKYARSNLISEGKNLIKSYRSVPEIIDYVNAIFTDETAISEIFGELPARDFLDIYSKHISAKENQKGYFSLKVLNNCKSIKADNPIIYEEIYQTIKRVKPLSHGKSCAVLVRKNDTVQEIIDYLRVRIADDNLGDIISVAGELESEIVKGNMVAPPFLQILKGVSHPLDKASLAYLCMTPYWEFVDGMSETFIEATMHTLLSDGYYSFYEKFADFTLKNAGKNNLDAYSTEALLRLGDACKTFDNEGGGQIDEFITYIEGVTYRTGTAENTIQVMTIHKSKGLGFDMVILPDIYYTSSQNSIEFGEFYENPLGTRAFKGVFLYPQKYICELNKELMDNRTVVGNERRFEDICAFYVALTRAKTAMHIIVPKGNTLSASIKLLISAAGAIATESSENFYSCGASNWYEDGKVESLTLPTLTPIEKIKLSPWVEFKNPSANDDVLDDEKSAKFGTLVHSIFERIKYFSDGDNLDAVVSQDVSKEDLTKARSVVFKTLTSRAGREIFSPKENVEIFAEFPFCVSVDDSLVVGRIDRIEIAKDENGNVVEIKIIDFKSTTNNLENYIGQLTSYKSAIAKMFAIKESKVHAIIFGYYDCKLAEI